MPTLRLISIAVLLGLSGCTWALGKFGGKLASKLQKDNRTGQAKVVGVIEMVNPDQQYVLINCEQRLNLPAGTEIISQNADGSKTKLKVTPERKGNYITADIKEGTPQVRDIVLYQLSPGELPPAPAATPGAPATTAPVESPAVQLTPVMEADVIPPLGTPFQGQPASPGAAMPSAPPARYGPPSLPEPAPAPSQPPVEAEPDNTGLPPVIR